MKTKQIKFIFGGLFGCFVLGAMIWMIKFCFLTNSPCMDSQNIQPLFKTPVILNPVILTPVTLADHIQQYFLLRENENEVDAFQKSAVVIQQAADAGDILCIATLALSQKRSDLETVKFLLPFFPKENPAACFIRALYYDYRYTGTKREMLKYDIIDYIQAAEYGFIPAYVPVALYMLGQEEMANVKQPSRPENFAPQMPMIGCVLENPDDPNSEMKPVFGYVYPEIPESFSITNLLITAANAGDFAAQQILKKGIP